jgi:phosphopantothenoylcysteine decarboxylase/phosphopantothenate--cysteine ligase
MGLAIASAALKRGWPTTLLLGPVSLAPPDGLEVHHFRTTAELNLLLKAHWPASDVLFMAAAVADFLPAVTTTGKLSRHDGPRSLELLPAPDLLKELAPLSRPEQTIVGFGLEPAEDLATRAHRKLKEKSLDALVANPLETMDSTNVDATLLVRDQPDRHPPGNLPKSEFATWLLEEVASFHPLHKP